MCLLWWIKTLKRFTFQPDGAAPPASLQSELKPPNGDVTDALYYRLSTSRGGSELTESGRPQIDSGASQSSIFDVIFQDDLRLTVNELLVLKQ